MAAILSRPQCVKLPKIRIQLTCTIIQHRWTRLYVQLFWNHIYLCKNIPYNALVFKNELWGVHCGYFGELHNAYKWHSMPRSLGRDRECVFVLPNTVYVLSYCLAFLSNKSICIMLPYLCIVWHIIILNLDLNMNCVITELLYITCHVVFIHADLMASSCRFRFRIYSYVTTSNIRNGQWWADSKVHGATGPRWAQCLAHEPCSLCIIVIRLSPNIYHNTAGKFAFSKCAA